MAEKPETKAGEDPAGELRGTLVRRLAVAGVLVAILLGVLAFFDHLASPPEEAEMPVFTQAVPVAPRKEVSQPVKPADEESPAPAVTSPEPAEAPPAPVVDAGVAAVPETARPVEPTRRVGTPSTAPQAVPVPARKPVVAPPPLAEETAPPEVATAPDARVVEAQPASAPRPVAPRLFSGFLLQAGVFSSVQRAEELHAKLTLSGVPSTLETRVQVGPFRTRQEAEAAQAKLKELGVQTILVAPAARR